MYLTFTAHRANHITHTDPRTGRHCTATELERWFAAATPDERAARASGAHARAADAVSYARREGPAYIIGADGLAVRVERQRDAAADERVAAEEQVYARRRPIRRMRGEG